MTGRPFRFLLTVAAGWVGVRAVLLWPEGEVPKVAERSALVAPTRDRPITAVAGRASVVIAPLIAARGPAAATPSGMVSALAVSPFVVASSAGIAAPPQTSVSPEPAAPAEGSLPSPLGLPDRGAESRWSGGVFAIARPSGTGGGLGSSQLGGSQVGARIAYALGDKRQIALVGRVATPLEGRGREAALGVEWRPPGVPVRFFAEQRFALDGGRGGPSLGVIAGVDRTLGRGFRLEAYGQAGAIRRGRTEGFADGAARVTRRVAAIGPATLDLGAGAWGGAQRGAERLDIGPTLGVATPVAGRTLRLTLDWRERAAGAARPGSGPALSIGTDF